MRFRVGCSIFFACMAMARVLSADVTNGLVGHWKLDETSGTVATDSSGNGHDGVYHNAPTLGDNGPHGNSPIFDGVSDYVSAEVDVNETDYTSAFWFKTTDPGAALFHTTASATSMSATDRILSLSSGNIRVRTWSNEILISTGLNLADGQWHHVVHLLGSGVSGQRVYVDGKLVLQGSKDTSDFSWQTHVVFAQVNPADAASPFLDGQIDDVRVYDRLITEQEILELHGLVGHWKLDETSGTVATDSSGQGNDGTYNGNPTLGGSGIYGGSAYFESHNQQVVVPSSPVLDTIAVGGADFSTAFWIKPDAPDGSWRSVFHKGNNHIDRGPGIWLRTSDNRIHYRLSTTSGPNEGTDSITSLPTGKWSHVAIVKQGNLYLCYVNGVLDRQLTLLGTSLGNSAPLYIADSPWYGPPGMRLDDIYLYNRALSASEVKELHGLLLHLKFDETSGTVAADSSGSGNHGSYAAGDPVLGENAPRGYGVTFGINGNDDVLSLPNVMDGLTEHSVSFWMKTDHNGDQAILSGASASFNNGYLIWFNSSSQIYLFYRHATVATWDINPVNDGRWRHFAIVNDSTVGEATLYINAVSQGARSFSSAMPLEVDPGGLLIGQEQDNVGGGFSASQRTEATLDDFRIYNRELNQDEIHEQYGLMLHLKLDESEGEAYLDDGAADSSPYDTNGVVNNVETFELESPRKKGMQFDGSTSYIEVDVPQMGHMEAISVACWAKSDTELWNNHGMFVSKRNQFVLHPHLGQENMAFYVYDKSAGWNSNIYANFSSTPNFDLRAWHHYVATYDPVQQLFKIFVDGKQFASKSYAATISNDSGPLLVGQDDCCGNRFFDGALDDVRVYNRALTDKQVAELYGLVGHWRFDETSGTIANDLTTFATHGLYYPEVELQQTVPAIAEGPYGARFPANQFVELPKAGQYQMLDGLTIAAWVYTEGGDERFYVLGREEENELPYALAIGDDLSPELLLNIGSPSGSVGSFGGGTTATVPLNAWRHLIATFNGSEVVYYINGVEVDRINTSGITIGAESTFIALGTCKDNTAGRLHDVRLYNRAITSEEASALYPGGSTPGIRIIKWVESR